MISLSQPKTLPKRFLAAALALAMLCPPGGGLLLAARAQDAGSSGAPSSPTIRIPMAPSQAGPIRTILLFPFSNALAASSASSGFNPDIVGARVEDAVKMRLNVIGRYKANSFSPNLPQIQRALSEARVEGLTENDITPPYDNPQKGQKIATQVGTDGYLIGAIESLKVDPTTRNVTLTVSASLYNTITGGTTKVLAYTGKGVAYNAADDPENLLQSAINDVAGQIASTLNASAPKETLKSADYVRGSRSNNTSLLLGILLAAGIGIALSSSHHSSSSSSSTGTTGGTTGGTIGGSTSDSSGPPNPPNVGS